MVNFFSSTWQKIKNIFSKVGTAIADGLKGAVTSAVNAILSKATGIINGFIRAINSAISILNKIPKVSISRIDELDAPQLAEGGVLKRGQVGILEGNGAEAVVPLEKNTGWIKKVAEDMAELTITLVKADGTQENMFRYRDKQSDVFEKISPGNHRVMWNGSFDFDLSGIHERGEPKWT